MTRLGDELAAILTALEAGGITTATSGKLAAPCVFVEPGDPWSEVRYGAPGRGRVSRWRLSAIAGAADTTAGILELAELVESVDTALRTIDGIQLPAWAAPAVRELDDGVRRRSAIATIQYASS